MLTAGKKEKNFTTRELSDYFKISYHHLSKVVLNLSQSRLIIVKKGKGGGLSIHPDALELPLGDLVQKLEPDFNLVECFDTEHNQCVLTGKCELKKELQNGLNEFYQYMNRKKLKDILSYKQNW